MLTSRDRTWWKNLQGGASVDLLLKRRLVKGFAETELDENAVEQCMYEFLRHEPRAAKPMGIRVENENLNAKDVARVAKDRLFVKIKISG
ncbi:MAG: hypothetical protein HZB18_09550 [Chloroflexi bacterium]|nr:hypothetical protein [Chloroflexota bacterium]